MCDMFLILKATYVTGYTNDYTLFAVRDGITDVIKTLEEIGENLLRWFSNNQMMWNANKRHLLLNSQKLRALKIGVYT